MEAGQVPEASGPEEAAGMDAEQLKEYLRNLNPEDFGRFNP